MASDAYKDLEEYGIIGNLETCALVGRDGSIDWLCFPHLESPSVFAAILDARKGGEFRISPARPYESEQNYIENTNILQTVFRGDWGRLVLTDFMKAERKVEEPYTRAVYRKVECTAGEADIEVRFAPRFDFARAKTILFPTPSGPAARWDGRSLVLQVPARTAMRIGRSRATGAAALKPGEVLWFVLQYGPSFPADEHDCERLLSRETEFWKGWAHKCAGEKCVIEEPWHDLVVRSGLVLKLLADTESGAIAAAATTSLPEQIGGKRNWDYRYAWIRDSSFTVQALFHLDHEKEARDFRRWMKSVVHMPSAPADIRIMYGIHGELDLRERVIENLSGYRDSRPVRTGNAAVDQVQLDIYGELVNAVYETTRYGEEVAAHTWRLLAGIIDYVCEAWKTKDSGIWEVRGGPRHFVYSKLMCWVALDRGIKIARLKSFKAPLARWERACGDIRRAILDRGFSPRRRAFVQAFDSDDLDATGLLISIMGLLPHADERVRSTVDAIMRDLAGPDGLVSRYLSADGLAGGEGAFVLCSFWLVKALALAGRLDEAEDIFARLLEHVGPLGLMAEEIDRKSGRQLGNFPQAFSHIGLVNSALYLGVVKGRKHKGPKPLGTA
jgi:GH15 family glucan-1,4-alpha-glucosidase